MTSILITIRNKRPEQRVAERYLTIRNLKWYINSPFHFRAFTANTNNVKCWLLEQLNRKSKTIMQIQRFAHHYKRRSGIHESLVHTHFVKDGIGEKLKGCDPADSTEFENFKVGFN